MLARLALPLKAPWYFFDSTHIMPGIANATNPTTITPTTMIFAHSANESNQSSGRSTLQRDDGTRLRKTLQRLGAQRRTQRSQIRADRAARPQPIFQSSKRAQRRSTPGWRSIGLRTLPTPRHMEPDVIPQPFETQQSLSRPCRDPRWTTELVETHGDLLRSPKCSHSPNSHELCCDRELSCSRRQCAARVADCFS